MILNLNSIIGDDSMKKILLLLSLLILSTTSSFAAESISAKTPTIAIIPYVNTTEETKDYVKTTIETNFATEFPKDKFIVVSDVDIQKALNASGYDSSNMELPEKDMMSAVAKATNADYVLAMEIDQLISSRHISFFSTKVETKAKLKYKFYNTAQDKATPFQTTGDFENSATLIGDVGYKEPITKSLNKAMDAAYNKIVQYL